MPTAYTPGLLVTPCARWRCRRVLPVAGRVLVRVGDLVAAEQVVAETELPGNVTPVPLAKPLGVAASQLPGLLKVQPGELVAAGDCLARSTGVFGWFPREARAPIDGTLESVSSITGLAILRGAPLKVQVKGYLAGRVVEVLPDAGVVLEAPAAVMQGIFGIGGEAYGPLRVVTPGPDNDLTPELLTAAHRGAIVVAGRRITKAAVDRARELGVSAVIGGGIDDQDLRDILGYDLGVAVTGMERLGLTVIITEGFGEIAMARRTFELLQRLEGRAAAVNGTTQIRAGVLRPEILIPVDEEPQRSDGLDLGGALAVGVPVRVIREPYFGELGRVTGLPAEPQLLASQSKARVVEVELGRGARVVVPRANVELIAGGAR